MGRHYERVSEIQKETVNFNVGRVPKSKRLTKHLTGLSHTPVILQFHVII